MGFENEEMWSAMKRPTYSQTISKIDDKVFEKTSIAKAIKAFVNIVVDTTQSVSGTFWYFDREANTIKPVYVYADKDLSGITLKPGQGIAGNVILTGKSDLVNECSNNSNWSSSSDKANSFTSKSIICSPVKTSKGLTIGCIQLVNSRHDYAFEDADVKLLDKATSEFVKKAEKFGLDLEDSALFDFNRTIIQDSFIKLYNDTKKYDKKLILDVIKGLDEYKKMPKMTKLIMRACIKRVAK